MSGPARAGAARYWWLWVPVLPLAAWALIRTCGWERGSAMVAILAFTPYAAVAALLTAGVALALRNWVAAAVATLATAAFLAAVLPRAIGSETTAPEGRRTLTVLSANIHHGTADPAALVDLVRRLHPQLLSIQELTPSFAAALRTDGIGRLLPYGIVATRPDWGGRGVYSTLPLRPLSRVTVSTTDLPRLGVALPGGGTIRLIDVHPHTPVSGPEARWRVALERLPSAGSGAPWLLVGDFNATLDHAALRAVIERGYRDAGEASGEGLEATWPANRSYPPLITIDHVLADRRLGIADYGVADLPGSDHRAIHATIVLPSRLR
ncbi:MAG TPA: endonuclease/exonuclease/phosphatase family protein [Solirubrobacterales bacterium]|nr:endonuclease/exonuclease/phosphatase family protein [Solirubrobacterales bacterium]